MKWAKNFQQKWKNKYLWGDLSLFLFGGRLDALLSDERF